MYMTFAIGYLGIIGHLAIYIWVFGYLGIWVLGIWVLGIWGFAYLDLHT